MQATRHKQLIHANRALIFALSSGGLLADGMQPADLLCISALFLWLWLALCVRLEARLLERLGAWHGLPGAFDRLDTFRRSTRSHGSRA